MTTRFNIAHSKLDVDQLDITKLHNMNILAMAAGTRQHLNLAPDAALRNLRILGITTLAYSNT